MKTADVIICGAGIIGCAAAYYTAKKASPSLSLTRMRSLETVALPETAAVSANPAGPARAPSCHVRSEKYLAHPF